MLTIYNGTPHPINLYNMEQVDDSNPRRLFVKEGQNPVEKIPTGTPLNAVKGNKDLPFHLKEESTAFFLKGGVYFKEVDLLPLTESGKYYDVYIVSNLYRSAFMEIYSDSIQIALLSHLATVDGVVYDNPENPRPCGCIGLSVG